MKPLGGLYAITDEQLLTEIFTEKVEEVLSGGARLLQYRNKGKDKSLQQMQSKQLRKLCDAYDTLLIINDDIELAKYCAADGVHLGENDGNLRHARQQLGDNKIIGASCYNSMEKAAQAAQEGADYLAFGSFFPSKTKPNAMPADSRLLSLAKARFKLPMCAIGGITTTNAPPLIAAGADMLAVITDLFSAANCRVRAQAYQALFAYD